MRRFYQAPAFCRTTLGAGRQKISAELALRKDIVVKQNIKLEQ